MVANPFRVVTPSSLIPGLLLCSNPGLELANAFGDYNAARKALGVAPASLRNAVVK